MVLSMWFFGSILNLALEKGKWFILFYWFWGFEKEKKRKNCLGWANWMVVLVSGMRLCLLEVNWCLLWTVIVFFYFCFSSVLLLLLLFCTFLTCFLFGVLSLSCDAGCCVVKSRLLMWRKESFFFSPPCLLLLNW